MHDAELSREIQTRMVSHNITKTDLAQEAGYTYRTIWLWIAKGMTPMRYDALNMAIDRVVERRGK